MRASGEHMGRARRIITSTHRWIGLTVGWLIVFAALTGATLAFRPQIEPVVYAPLMTGAPCATRKPIDEIVNAARLSRGGEQALYVRGFGEPGAAYRVRFNGNATVYVDPCTARVLGEQNRYAGLFGTVELLHTLHFSKIGSLVAGTNALIFAFLIISSGLYMLWPMLRRNARRIVAPDKRLEGRAWNLSVHRSVALWASPVLLVIALTGAPQALEWLEEAIYSTTGSQMEQPIKTVSAGPRRMTLQAAYARALDHAPHASEILLHIPAKARDSFEIYIIAADAPHPNARTYLYLDPITGKTLRYTPYAQSSLGAKIFYWIVSLHTGGVGGLFGRLILFLAAAATVVLGYTGLRSYLRGRRQIRDATHPSSTPTLAMRVLEVNDETANVRTFTLSEVNDAPLPDMTPGSHIDVHLSHGLVRQYSLINGPDETGIYRIAVRRAPASRGGSSEMHESVNVGDLLTIGAPRNHFPIIHGAQHHRLVAGGIGITPLLSMARHLLAGGSDFYLDYFTRSAEATPFGTLLEDPAFGGRVRFHYGVPLERMADYARPLLAERKSGSHLYVCGSSQFISSIEEAAASDWPSDTIHHEHFAADPSAWSAPRQAFEVTLARSGRTIAVAADRTIAEALAEHGFPTTTSCEQGVCGSCLTRVIQGVPEHRDSVLTPAQRKEGTYMTICVSRAAQGPLVLDL